MTNTQHTSGQHTSGSPPDRATTSTAEELTERARGVADTGKEQAAHVVDEAKSQTAELLHEARSQARGRADGQVSQLAGVLDTLSGELRAMADGTSHSDGYLTTLARDGARTAKDLSERLRTGGLDGALDDVRRFARRRPVAFLAVAFGVGLAAGRVTRNAPLGEIVSGDASTSTSNGRSDASGTGGRPTSPASGTSSPLQSSSQARSPSQAQAPSGTAPVRPDLPGERDRMTPSPSSTGTAAAFPPESST